MQPILQHLNLPWTLALLALVIGLLALAFLRALRRRRTMVPGLAVFVRAKAQNLPPAAPPRFLDRAFYLKALLLALLVLIVAGLAVQSTAAQPRRIAVLLDDGPAGAYQLAAAGKPAGHLSDRLQAEATRLSDDFKKQDGVQVDLVPASTLLQASGPSVAAGHLIPSGGLQEALERLRLPGTTRVESAAPASAGAYDEIHLVTARPAPQPAEGANTLQSAATKIVWHMPAFELQPNEGIVRIWLEPAAAENPAQTDDAPAQPAATPLRHWALYAEITAGNSVAVTPKASPSHFWLTTSSDGKSWSPLKTSGSVVLDIPLTTPADTVIGPLQFTDGDFQFIRLSLAPEPPATDPAKNQIHSDGLNLDNEIILARAPTAPLTAIVDSTANTPMINGALAAWQIPVEDATTATTDEIKRKRPGPRLFLCDGSREALARLEKLRPAPGPPAASLATILPVFFAPPGDLPGVQFESDPPKTAESTSVPAANPAYALLGRQSWRIESLRAAKLPYGATVVVQTPVGPAIVRLIDPEGRPAWAILFDPAHSTLANRHAAAWLALWDQIATDARNLTGDGAGSAAGWVWSGPNYPLPRVNPLDRRITALASSSGSETVLSPGATGASSGAASTAPAASTSLQTWSLASLAAILGLLLLFSLAGAPKTPEPAQ
ncbi:MAG TPA: hypothetical protein VL860_14485 [Planctomycetota bacterium]|nr:hypothetical protein [Planctomycetota bacterium]